MVAQVNVFIEFRRKKTTSGFIFSPVVDFPSLAITFW
jgi:hypothetical protein